MKNIELIAIKRLQHHPDNPRKNLGDLTELAESIKTNGIMQNLTVVRSENLTGYYDVIIGNRRLEAANLAGLKELPCAIVELSPQEQMATMLAENMQRADLTILEQAQGFQYMMDLGEGVKSISEKTGFSASTIRRRVKLLELDTEKLEKAVERQISLEDIDKINSIDDIEERNKLLDYAGTGNFGWAFNCAQRTQKQKALYDKIRKMMTETKLKEVEAAAQWGAKQTKERVGCLNFEAASKKEDDLKSAVEECIKKYADKSDSYALEYTYLYLLVDKKPEKSKSSGKTKKEKELEEEKARRKKNAEELNIASKTAYQLRYDFIANYPNAQAKKHYKGIVRWIARLGAEVEDEHDYYDCNFCNFSANTFRALSELNGENEEAFKETAEKAMTCPEKLLLNLVYAAFDDDKDTNYLGWDGGYNDIHSEFYPLDELYKFLEALGYEMSDAEKSLQDGTHELFYKPDTKGDSNGKAV